MKTWAEIWEQVPPLIHESRSTAEAADKVSELRGVRTNWYSVGKAWRRRVKAGWVGPTETALASLGKAIPPPRNALEERVAHLERGLRHLLHRAETEDRRCGAIGTVFVINTVEELLGHD